MVAVPSFSFASPAFAFLYKSNALNLSTEHPSPLSNIFAGKKTIRRGGGEEEKTPKRGGGDYLSNSCSLRGPAQHFVGKLP